MSPVYKAGDIGDLTNYRPNSVLPWFSKILEIIMCNRLFSYVSQEKKIYSKQFGFQSGHSTEHAILQLANQIRESFENNLYTLGVFTDLSKAFDTINHSTIILKKLEIYDIHEKTLNSLKLFKKLMRKIKQTFYQLHVEFHKVQYWDHFCSYFMLTNCRTPQTFLI